MSRIGKQPIEIPTGTDIKREGNKITVKGPKGELAREFKDIINIEINDNIINLTPKNNDKFSISLWGTYASHLKNMIQGVSNPFEKKLIIEGVGYRAETSGNKLVLKLGFSHKIEEEILDGLNVVVEKSVITVSGIDKEKVGLFTSKIRAYKKPEPYKGKGIHYEGEVIKRKEGKRAV